MLALDSLTQAALGAAVGVAVAGRRVGVRRAALAGAVGGTIPDLDIVAYPFLDTAGELIVHRGVTHGLAFGFVVGPLLGWLSVRWAEGRARRARARGTPPTPAGGLAAWAWLWTLALVTHPLLDVLTIYGTQLLAPFSRTPFSVGSVFIVDPLYTVPLLVGVGVAVWRRRVRPATVGLVFGTLYLALGLGLQAQARATVREAYAARGLEPARVVLGAGPLSVFVWQGVAEVDGRAEPFWLHVADRPEAVRVGPPLAFADLPPTVAASRGGQTLGWFTRGWLVGVPEAKRPADAPDGAFVLADPRFGRAGVGGSGPLVFVWTLGAEPPHVLTPSRPPLSTRADDFRRLVAWITTARLDPPAARPVPPTPPPASPPP